MRSLSRALVITALAVSLPATLVLAQGEQSTEANGAAATTEASSAAVTTRQERLLEGKFAFVKEALKLNEAQTKLWAPVEEQIRATQAKRAEMRKTWREKREQRRAERSSGTSAEQGPKERKHVSLPDRLERRSQRLAERAEKMKKFAEVLKPFYESLNDEQRDLVGPVMRQFRVAGLGGHHGHRGHRWADRGWDRH
jgi:hypothetical protein